MARLPTLSSPIAQRLAPIGLVTDRGFTVSRARLSLVSQSSMSVRSTMPTCTNVGTLAKLDIIMLTSVALALLSSDLANGLELSRHVD